jgi:hypothetical protein
MIPTSPRQRDHRGCLPPRRFAKVVRSVGAPVAGQWRYELNGRGNTATDFAFEREVFLHSGFLHGECGGSLCPRRGRHASIACEGEKFRFARSLFRSA